VKRSNAFKHLKRGARMNKVHNQLEALKETYASKAAGVVVRAFDMKDAIERPLAFAIANDVALNVAMAIVQAEFKKRRTTRD